MRRFALFFWIVIFGLFVLVHGFSANFKIKNDVAAVIFNYSLSNGFIKPSGQAIHSGGEGIIKNISDGYNNNGTKYLYLVGDKFYYSPNYGEFKEMSLTQEIKTQINTISTEPAVDGVFGADVLDSAGYKQSDILKLNVSKVSNVAINMENTQSKILYLNFDIFDAVFIISGSNNSADVIRISAGERRLFRDLEGLLSNKAELSDFSGSNIARISTIFAVKFGENSVYSEDSARSIVIDDFLIQNEEAAQARALLDRIIELTGQDENFRRAIIKNCFLHRYFLNSIFFDKTPIFASDSTPILNAYYDDAAMLHDYAKLKIGPLLKFYFEHAYPIYRWHSEGGSRYTFLDTAFTNNFVSNAKKYLGNTPRYDYTTNANNGLILSQLTQPPYSHVNSNWNALGANEPNRGQIKLNYTNILDGTTTQFSPRNADVSESNVLSVYGPVHKPNDHTRRVIVASGDAYTFADMGRLQDGNPSTGNGNTPITLSFTYSKKSTIGGMAIVLTGAGQQNINNVLPKVLFHEVYTNQSLQSLKDKFKVFYIDANDRTVYKRVDALPVNNNIRSLPNNKIIYIVFDDNSLVSDKISILAGSFIGEIYFYPKNPLGFLGDHLADGKKYTELKNAINIGEQCQPAHIISIVISAYLCVANTAFTHGNLLCS